MSDLSTFSDTELADEIDRRCDERVKKRAFAKEIADRHCSIGGLTPGRAAGWVVDAVEEALGVKR